jgi:hypothetical protein
LQLTSDNATQNKHGIIVYNTPKAAAAFAAAEEKIVRQSVPGQYMEMVSISLLFLLFQTLIILVSLQQAHQIAKRLNQPWRLNPHINIKIRGNPNCFVTSKHHDYAPEEISHCVRVMRQEPQDIPPELFEY